MRSLSLVGRVSLVTLVLMGGLALILGLGIQWQSEDAMLRQEAESAADQVAGVLDNHLRPTDLARPLDPDRYAAIDRVVRDNILADHIVRVKIWSRSGLLVYSDARHLAGRHFPLSPRLQQALAGTVARGIASLAMEHHASERGRYTRLAEIYVPLRLQGSMDILGAYEVYHDLAVLEPGLGAMRRFVWLSVAVAFLVLYGALVALVRNASRQLVRGNEENARLYGEANERLAELSRIESTLRASEERFRSLAEAAPDAIVTMGTDGNIRLFNHAAERLFGYPASEVVGRDVTVLLPGDYREPHTNAVRRYLETGEARILGKTVEAEGLRKGDERFPVELSCSAIRTPTEVTFTAVIRDITERKRREAIASAVAEVQRGLAENLELTRISSLLVSALVEIFHVRVCVLHQLDEAAGELVCTAAAGEEADALWIRHRIPSDTGVAGLALRERRAVWSPDLLHDSRITLPADLRERLQRHEYRSVVGVPVVSRGRWLGSLALGDRPGRVFSDDDLDILSRFASQAAVALENARLYQELQQAYENLSQAQEQLVHAQKMEAVGRLAGGVAHDFNNLLTIVIGHAEILLSQLPEGAAIRRHIDLIQQTARRGAALAARLLAFSRKQHLEPRVLDLDTALTDLARMLERVIGEDIELVLRPSGGPRWVKVDPGQLEQVIMNLVINARDAMPAGGRLTIETGHQEVDEEFAGRHPGARPGPYAVIRVSDTGVGMSAETRSRIFEPFYTTKEAGRGTGLGLAVVYGIVEQHDGVITVDSAPGRGATFSVYLPLTDEPGETPSPGLGKSAMPRGTETILLVEDEDAVRHLVREILSECGYAVLHAEHPDRAIEIAAAHPGPIHLLLTDVVMPGMHGPELRERLAPSRPAMKVLYMSGYASNSPSLDGSPEAETLLVHKPFTVEGLARKVREVLG